MLINMRSLSLGLFLCIVISQRLNNSLIPFACNGCNLPLTDLTASSIHSVEFAVENIAGTSSSGGIWCSAWSNVDPNPWIKAAFTNTKIITGIKLRGGGEDYSSNGIQSFTVSFSEDNSVSVPLRENHVSASVKVFEGLTSVEISDDLIKEYSFPYTIQATEIRLDLVLAENTNSTCLRMDLLQPPDYCSGSSTADFTYRTLLGSDYIVNQVNKTYDSGGRYCRSLGYSLPSFTSATYYNLFRLKLDTDLSFYKSDCSCIWIGLHGEPGEIAKYSDGVTFNLNSYLDNDGSDINPPATAIMLKLLETSAYPDWLYVPMTQKCCTSCWKRSNSGKPIVMVDQYVTHTENQVYILTLQSSSGNVDITIDADGLVTTINQTLIHSLNFTTRNSPILSKFELQKSLNGKYYSVAIVTMPTNGTKLIKAVSNPTGSSVKSYPLVVAVYDDPVLPCLNRLTINGTGTSQLTSRLYPIGSDQSFNLVLDSQCPADLDIGVTTWQLGHMSLMGFVFCAEAGSSEYIAVNMSQVSGLNNTYVNLTTLLESTGIGCYEVCTDISAEYGQEVFTGHVCGYVQLVKNMLSLVMEPDVIEMTHDRSTPLVLNMSASYNPLTGVSQGISYEWTCVKSGQQCDFVKRKWPTMPNVNPLNLKLPVTGPILEIEGRYLTAGGNVTITAHVEDDTEQLYGYFHDVTVLPYGTPYPLTISASCTSGCGPTSDTPIVLQVTCSNCIDDIASTAWSLHADGEEINATHWLPFVNTSTAASVTIPNGVFNPLKEHLVTAIGTEATGDTGTASVSLPKREIFVTFLPLSHIVYTDTFDMFLILVNHSSTPSVQITHDFTCTPAISLVNQTARSTYPLSAFALPPETDGMWYSLISHQYTVPGMYQVRTNVSVDAQIITSIVSVKAQNKDEHQCLTSLEVEGTGKTLESAKTYTRGKHIHFSPRYVDSCDDMVILSHNWTLFHADVVDLTRCTFEDDYLVQTISEVDDTDNHESFHVLKHTLPLGYNRLCVTVSFVSSSGGQHTSRGCGYIKVINEPMVASLSPRIAFLTMPSSRSLHLNASDSYDPNSDDQTGISYTWSCDHFGEDCNLPIPLTNPTLEVSGGILAVGELYQFTVTVSKTGLTSDHATLTVLATNPTTPSLIIRCVYGCGEKLNPSEQLAVTAECPSCENTGIPVVSYSWEVTSLNTGQTISDEQVIDASTTGINHQGFVLNAGFLNVSDVYSIKVIGVNSYSESGSAEYQATTNSPPVPGTCSISPLSGQALVSHFSLTCAGFHDDDTPLVYKVFREKSDGTSQLLSYGYESTVSHLTLPTGPSSTNYTHTLTVAVLDSYHTNTSLTVNVQVVALALKENNNESLSDLVFDLVQNFTTDSVHESQGVLQFVGSVADILNEESTDQSNNSVGKRAEVRETILTKLTTVPIDNQETMQQMSDIIGDLTAEEGEVTDNIQELAVNVSGQVTEGLASVAETAPTVAKTIAQKQLSTLEKLIELSVGQEESPAVNTTDNTTATPTSETKAKPILDLYEKIGDAMLRGIKVSNEKPLKIQAKKTSLTLSWMRADDGEDVNLSSQLQGGTVGGQFQMPLASSLQANSAGDVQAVNFQVQVMADNPYVWDETASSVNKPVVNILLKSRDQGSQKLQLNNLPQPASIFIDSNTTVSGTIEQDVNVTVDNNMITYSTSHLITIPSDNTSSTIFSITTQSGLTLSVLAVSGRNITYTEIKDSGQDIPIPAASLQTFGSMNRDPNLLILTPAAGSNYSIGFMVKSGQFHDSGGLNVSTITVKLESYRASCSYWDEDDDLWSTDGCQVGMFTTRQRLHCQCKHLTAFSGGIFVAPNTVDPIADLALFLTFFDNPVVVTTCLAIWGVYLLLLYWARQKDKDDTKKVGMTVLRDNEPDDKYVYLICVVTSWWPQAGTTANVFLYLRSRYRQSARHMLADPDRKLFTAGAENWFVLTTPKRLGRIKSVVVWHDNRGKSPSWYLKEVVVYDIQAKEEWHCLYDDWLAVDRGPGVIQIEIPSLLKSDIVDRRLYQLTLKASQDFRNGHLWISIFSKPAYNRFTRAQRLTCGLSLLITTMLSSIMFFGVPTDDPEDQVQHGTVSISLSGILIGIQSGLMMFPINTIIIQLFMKTNPRHDETEEDGVLINKSTKSLGKGTANENRSKQTVTDSKRSIPAETNGSKTKSRLLLCHKQNESDSDNSDSGDRNCCCRLSCHAKESDSKEYVSSSTESQTIRKRFLCCGSNNADDEVTEFRSPSKESTGMCGVLSCCGKKGSVDETGTREDVVDVGMSRGKVNTSQEQGDECGEKKQAKATKKPFGFPWWFIYIAWGISLSTCIICTYFVMLYGLKYGYQISVDWLVSFFTAFTQSALVTQPIKVMLLAVLLTQILRKPVQYESWGPNQDIEEASLERMTEQQKLSNSADVQQRFYVPPLSVKALREIRKRLQLDNKARAILYEIGLYFTFVAIVLLMIYGHRNIDKTYLSTRSTENMFTTDTGFSEVSSVDSMWTYLKEELAVTMVTDDEGVGLTSNKASYLLGKARLRQLRVKPGLCNYPRIMSMFAPVSCTDAYWITDEDTRSFNTSWDHEIDSPADAVTPYTYQSAYDLVTIPFVGKLATYGGGGYVQELPKLPNASQALMESLQQTDWIDQHTRAVFAEFTLYNPNVDLFSVVVLVFEFTNFGKILPYYQIFTSNLFHYAGGFQTFVAVCEGIFLVYLFIFTYLEVKKYRSTTTREYFDDVWSYIEVIIIILSYTVFGLFIQRIVSVEYSLNQYREGQGQSYVSFYPAASADIILQYVMSSLSVFIIVKFFKLLRFNVRMSLLAGTLKRSKNLLFQFSIKVFIFTICFASVGVVLFGTELYGYKDFGECIITLFNFALGASDFFGLESANRILGPVFFFAFYFLYQCLLIMIFCTILMDGYASMVIHIMTLKTEIHMVEFLIRKIKLMTMTDKKKIKKFQANLYEIQTDT